MKRTTRHALTGFAALLLAPLAVLHAEAARAADDLSWLDAYNVVWDAPSKDATGSMPLSGGNLGLNVWVEGDDLLFYIGSPDSRVEDQKLVKLGRVRLRLSSLPFRKSFRMQLDLAESCIRITGEGAALKLWVDAFQPVVHVEMQSSAPVTASVAYESWRFTAAPITDGLEWCYRLDPAKSDRPGKIKAQRVRGDCRPGARPAEEPDAGRAARLSGVGSRRHRRGHLHANAVSVVEGKNRPSGHPA